MEDNSFNFDNFTLLGKAIIVGVLALISTAIFILLWYFGVYIVGAIFVVWTLWAAAACWVLPRRVRPALHAYYYQKGFRDSDTKIGKFMTETDRVNFNDPLFAVNDLLRIILARTDILYNAELAIPEECDIAIATVATAHSYWLNGSALLAANGGVTRGEEIVGLLDAQVALAYASAESRRAHAKKILNALKGMYPARKGIWVGIRAFYIAPFFR